MAVKQTNQQQEKPGMAHIITGKTNQVIEWSYTSDRERGDPFNELELDVIVKHRADSWRIPAYWQGGREWRVRFCPPKPGSYKITTICTDVTDSSLHGVSGTLDVAEDKDDNPLFSHGPLRVAASKRTFEHADGKPFFWLGDTWWMGLSKRLSWPEDFQLLTVDRVVKGFTVIQIVAGLYLKWTPLSRPK